MTILILFWVVFTFLGFFSVETQKSLVWYRLNFGAITLFFIASYFFSIYFPRKTTENHLLNKLITLLCFILFIFSVFSNWIINDVVKKEWGMEIVFGRGKLLYYLPIIILTFLILYNLFKKYFILTTKERLKVQYVLLGIFIFALANLIFNVVLPFIIGTVQFSLFGDYSAIISLGFTAYAIVKRELFGMRIVLTELLVGLIAVLLLVNVLVSESTFEYIWKGVLFLLFLIFGYLLIKSVLKEIQYRQELQRAYEDLKVLDKAKSEFISMASHQLRTPLTAIKGYISMMMEGTYGDLPGAAKEKLKNVYQSSERLIRIVNDLLDISKIELGKMELNKEKTQVEKLIEDVCQEMAIRAKDKNLKLEFRKPKTKLPEIETDSLKIRQVISNLIDNAIRYTQKGEIEVRAEKTSSSILISVRDTGEGLTKGEEKRIFEGFTRGRAGINYWIEGAGLGLYVAKRYIDLHLGKIWAESEGKGKGSTFFVELPIK